MSPARKRATKRLGERGTIKIEVDQSLAEEFLMTITAANDFGNEMSSNDVAWKIALRKGLGLD